MSDVFMGANEGHDADLEMFECIDCECTTSEADFESVDDELDRQYPRCPPCQSANRIAHSECDCGEPASYEVESGFLCEDCYEHYVSGYIRD